jgi:hypothetical protein
VCNRLTPIHRLAEEHSPVEQRHLAARRLASAPAKVYSPWSQTGGLCLAALTEGVSRSGMAGWTPRASNSV